ncbi:DUF1707 SHOCT-like domain-containing protein [Actinomycetospora sp. CA-053990]|uniref:DUF1707 SHOCT-like domain-containing protein n=1 Tax=Actinomycetospora sp. CA-053990 TaxID=3239891 RepID=UPI003D8A8CD2
MDTEGAAEREGQGDPEERRSRLPDRSGPPDLRVSDAERAAALQALGTHLEAGRLDIDEFGERSARAAVAVHRSDLEPLFLDLPAPHPPLPHPHVAPPPPVLAAPAPEQVRDRRPAPAGPALGVALVMLLVLVLPALLVGAAATGSAGGLLVLPLLFLVLGARHGRWHGRGPGGHGHGGRHGPHGPW